MKRIQMNETQSKTFIDMCVTAYINNIEKPLNIQILAQQANQGKVDYNATTPEQQHILRWMRIVWAFKPCNEFRELIEAVMQLEIQFPAEIDPNKKYLCSHCDNTGCGAFLNGKYVVCSDFEELKN